MVNKFILNLMQIQKDLKYNKKKSVIMKSDLIQNFQFIKMKIKN